MVINKPEESVIRWYLDENGMLCLVPLEGYTLSYCTSSEESDWAEYKGPITLAAENTTYYFRAVPASGKAEYKDVAAYLRNTESAIDNKGTFTLDDVIFSGNTASEGGAVYNRGTITLDNAAFSGNIGAGTVGGGAIFNDYGSITLNTADFSGNIMHGNGGAIYNSGAISLTSGTFRKNTASDYYSGNGGAIYNSGTIAIGGAIFTHNTASYGGGAICNSGTVTLTGDATFSNNTAGRSHGGAICNSGAVSVAGDVTFAGNTAAQYGGAIYNAGTVSISGDATFTGNTVGYGGAIYNSGTITLGDADFSGNTASCDGGAICNNGGTILLTAGTFYGNIAESRYNGGGAIYNGGTITLGDVTFSGNTTYSGHGGAIYNNGRGTSGLYWIENGMINIGGAVTLATNTDTIYNMGILNWDLTVGNTAAYGSLAGYQWLTNEGGTLTVTVAAEQTEGTYVLATGDLSDLTGKDTFTLTGTTAEDVSLTVGCKTAYNGLVYTLSNVENSNLLLSVESPLTERVVVQYGENCELATGRSYMCPAGQYSGGAVENSGTITGEDVTFISNSANSYGGAIYNGGVQDYSSYRNYTSGMITLSDTIFRRNTAQEGGAIWNSGTVALSDVSFSENNAAGAGGVIYNSGIFTLDDATFSGNTTGAGGGGYYYNGYYYSNGGAIFNTYTGVLTLNDAIFSENAGGAIYNAGLINLTGTVTLDTCSDTWFNYCGTTNWDLTEAAPGASVCINGFQYFCNSDTQSAYYRDPAAPQTITIAEDQAAGRYILATGDLSSLAGKDSFTVNCKGMVSDALLVGGTHTGTFAGRTIALAVENSYMVLDISAIQTTGIGVNDTTALETGGLYQFNCSDYDGGAVSVGPSGVLTGESVTFRGNTSQDGGAVFNIGKVSLTAGTFSRNKARGSGGAIYNAGEFSLTTGTFSRNMAGDSDFYGGYYGYCYGGYGSDNRNSYGGVICNTGSMTLESVSFSENSAYYGGVIYNTAYDKTIILNDATFSENRVFYNNSGDDFSRGGAIYNEYGVIILDDATFTGNMAGGDGGAIYNTGSSGSVTLYNATFSENGVSGYSSCGGAICNKGGSITLNNVAFSENKADYSGRGGAIYNAYDGGTAVITLDDVSFSGNIACNGGAVYNEGTINLTGAVTLVTEDDTWVNCGITNWDLTEAAPGASVCINGFQYFSNSGSSGWNRQTITIAEDQAAGEYVIATGDLSSLSDKNEFTLTGIDGAQDQVITVDSTDPVVYGKNQYTLARNESGNALILTVPIPTTITITAASDSKIYDGIALTNSGYSYNGKLAEGDELVATVEGTVTGAGTTYNEVTSYKVMRGETDVTACYEIKTKTGTLEVKARAITVTTDSAEKIYDGSALTAGTYTVTEGTVVDGEDLSITVNGSLTDAGTAANTVSECKVKRGENDVTDNYAITVVSGTLTVDQRNVILTSGSAEKYYDGTPLTYPSITVSGDGWAKGEGMTYEFTGSQTEPGSSGNSFTYFYADGTRMDNYNIIAVEGTLSVIAWDQQVTITVASNSKKYDGTALISSCYTVTGLAKGHTISVTISGEITDCGMAMSQVDSYRILDASGNDVTAAYSNVRTVDGTLKITKRDVTITSADASKKYDGTMLISDTVTVSGDGFADGEGATYKVTGSQTEVGFSSNTVTYTLNDGTKADNYNVTTVEGTLTVTPISTKPITITVDTLSRTYDGTALEATYSFTQGVLVAGDELVVTLDNTGLTDAGSCTVNVTGYKVMRGETDVTGGYIFTDSVAGSLEVTKRNVTMTSGSDSKIYDGTMLISDTVTVSGDGFADGEGATYTVTGSQTEVGFSSNTFTYTLNNGTNAENYNIAQNYGTLTVISPDLKGTADRISWAAIPGAAGYMVEYSQDNFQTGITVQTETTAVDTYLLPEGTWQWRVRAAEEGANWAVGPEITVPERTAGAEKAVSVQDNDLDLFFGTAGEVWGTGFYARHVGNGGSWRGTWEDVALEGKNRISDIFEGSEDASTLVLTDDGNGDALFLDDVYTAFPSDPQARVAQIDEIRAGAGNDVIDLTSQTYEYTGKGMTVRGGTGDDVIWAGKGEHQLFGDGGNDRIIGGAGKDVIAGGSGDDTLHGGGGDDIFCFCDEWGTDTVKQRSGGSVTLWFQSGSANNWDQSSMTYTDGSSSVKVSGMTGVTLKFGDDGSEQYDTLLASGAFRRESSVRVFAAQA